MPSLAYGPTTNLGRISKALSALGGEASALSLRLRQLLSSIDRADAVARRIHSLAEQVRGINKIISVLKTTLIMLQEIPCAGIVVSGVQRILTGIGQILKPLNALLNKFDTFYDRGVASGLRIARLGTEDIQRTMAKIGAGTRVSAATLGLLNALHVAAIPFARVEGSPIAPLAKKIEEIGGSVEEALTPVTDTFDGIARAEKDLRSLLASVIDNASDRLEDVIRVTSDIFDKLKPLQECIDTVLGAVAPLRWLNDGLTWFSDHVIEPAVKFIFDTFNINKLINYITGQITVGLQDALHILSDFMQFLEGEALRNIMNWIGDDAAKALASHQKQLFATLDALQPHSNESFRDALLRAFRTMAHEFAGPMPAWPQATGDRGQ